MCSRARARSVAAMRPSLLLRLTAAAGATAAVLAAAPAAGAADAVYGGSSGDDAIVLKGDSKFTTLRSIVISWRATCDDDTAQTSVAGSAPCAPSEGFIRLPDHYRRHQLEGRHRLSFRQRAQVAQSRAKGARGQFGSRQAAPPGRLPPIRPGLSHHVRGSCIAEGARPRGWAGRLGSSCGCRGRRESVRRSMLPPRSALYMVARSLELGSP